MRSYGLHPSDELIQHCFLCAANQILGKNHVLHLLFRKCTKRVEVKEVGDLEAWFLCHKDSTIKHRVDDQCASFGNGSINVPWGIQCTSIPSADPKDQEGIQTFLKALQLRINGVAPNWMFLTVGTLYIIMKEL